MFLFAFLLLIFVFLAIGAVVFLCCAVSPKRRYALSAALWFACWGPCLVALEMLAGLSIAAGALAAKGWGAKQIPVPPLPAWGAYAALGLIVTVLLASTGAWLHQALIERMTFALFRLYATAVVAGIGSVFGWSFSILLAINSDISHRALVAAIGFIMLTAGFGYCGFRWARSLRGPRPDRMQWITQAEF